VVNTHGTHIPDHPGGQENPDRGKWRCGRAVRNQRARIAGRGVFAYGSGRAGRTVVGLVSSAAAPVLLAGGWTVAAALQPHSFNAVTDTISSLAAKGAADRWVMTAALAGLGTCHIVTGLALRPAAPAGRLILMTGGVATVLVAANPEPAGGGSLPHTVWAAVGFIALTAWPLAARKRGPLVPAALRSAVSAAATGVLLGLLVWFGAELIGGGQQVGLAERVLAGAQALWPLAVVLACRRSQPSARLRCTGPPGADLQN
jgi:hypothetical membrane protein